MDGFINKAITLGAKYYCIKPFDLDTLKDRVEDIAQPKTGQNTFYNAKNNNHIEEKITNIFITVGIPARRKISQSPVVSIKTRQG